MTRRSSYPSGQRKREPSQLCAICGRHKSSPGFLTCRFCYAKLNRPKPSTPSKPYLKETE